MEQYILNMMKKKRVKSISEKSKNGSFLKVLEYTYNDYSEIASYTDYKEGVTYYYNYDYQNRLINVNATNGNTITYEYDESSRLIKKTNVNGSSIYEYDNIYVTNEKGEEIAIDKLHNENLSNIFNINYTYSNDSFTQLETISYFIQTNAINKNYTYETTILDGTTYYTGRVKSFEYTSGNNQLMKYVYAYDKYNNITNIMGYENNVLVYQEDNAYDIYNQLITQYVLAKDKEIGSEYFYDSRGNISGYYALDIRSNQVIYSYNFFYNQNGNKNKLVKVESNTTGEEYNIEYSANGEPSLYLGWTISYDMKNITTVLNSNYEINYTYNASGIRTSKIVTKNNSTTTTEYILDGTNIIKEIRSGYTNAILQYFYDSNDEIIGFTYNNVRYLYLKNLQKDIIGIVDSNNNIVVKYYYNAYGRIINKVDTSGINLSEINPFRYCGYYQDNETGWYYLNSRFYDIETLRFITMDDVDYLGASGSVLSYNLYSYCENNPVNHIDTSGNLSIPRSIISIPVDIIIFTIANPISSTWATITQPIKAGAKKLGKAFVKTTFKKGILRFFNTLKSIIIKVCTKLVPLLKKTLGRVFKKWAADLTAVVLAETIIGAMISFTANKFLDKIVDNITVFLSIGGLFAGFLDWVTDGSLNNKIKLDFWRK